MVYGYPDYQSELGNINLRIESCETGIRMNERKIRKLREALSELKIEYNKLENHIEDFKNNLCEVEDWQGTRYWEHVNEVNRVRKMLYSYNWEIEESITSIEDEIEELETGISSKKSEIKKLNSRRNQLRKEAKKKKSLENPLGSGTY
ncbi:MAG TPA: DUF5082 family protein, partial [Tissierellales bacterium]|nr:DUF5082 family protein [Tissierellales bacterium]